MSYTFELDSPNTQERQIAAVRDEIDDVTTAQNPIEGADYFLTDERITRRLNDAERAGRSESNVAKLAAAAALDTLATNQVYVLKVGQTLGESRDGSKVEASIRAHAKSLRAQVQNDENPPVSNAPRQARRRASQSTTLRPRY